MPLARSVPRRVLNLFRALRLEVDSDRKCAFVWTAIGQKRVEKNGLIWATAVAPTPHLGIRGFRM